MTWLPILRSFLHRRVAALQAQIEYGESKIEYWHAVEAHDEQAAAGIARDIREPVLINA